MVGIKRVKGAFNFFVDITRDIMLKKIDDRYLNFSSSLNVYSYSKKNRCVFLADNKKVPLWGIELVHFGNIPIRKEIELTALIKNYRHNDNAKITLFYSKNKVIDEKASEDFYTKQSIYLFSQNKQLLEDIAYLYGVELLTVDKIFQAFYDIGFINEYYTDEANKLLKSRFHFNDIKIDDINTYFKMIFAEGVYGALCPNESIQTPKYNLYQGVEPKSPFSLANPNLHQIFKLDWFGYIAINFDFSHISVKSKFDTDLKDVKNGEINKQLRKRFVDTEEYKEYIYDNGVVGNIVMAIDNPKMVKTIGNLMNVVFIPKSTLRKDIIYSTPLLRKDSHYNFIANANEYMKYIQIVHKKHNILTRMNKNFYGTDLMGNFINYGFSDSGEGLHGAIVAPTRSGKTFFILKLIQHSLGITISPKTTQEIEIAELESKENGAIFSQQKIESAINFDKVKIVHFDKGYSAIRFMAELKKKYPKKVHLVSDDVNNIRFSLLNIRKERDTNNSIKLNEEDILFSISIINVILELNEEEPLNINEIAEFQTALNNVFLNNDFRGMTLYQLKELNGYDEIVQRVRTRANELNISRDDYNLRLTDNDLDLENSDLCFLVKPIMNDIVLALQKKIENFTVTTDTKNILSSLIVKIKSIAKMNMFAYYDQAEVVDTDYYYFELNRLKDLGEKFFLPAFLMVFNKLYRRDMANAQKLKTAGKEVPHIIYIIEEADNFIKVKVLQKLFEVILREASRFGITLNFITQNPHDIPQPLLTNIHTRMMLSSNEINDSDILYFWSKNPNDEESKKNKELVDFYMNNKTSYLTFISSASGIFTVKNYVTKEEASLFNSNGIEIKKIDVEKVA